MFSSLILSCIYFLKYGAFLLSYVSGSNVFPKPLAPKEEEECVKKARLGDKEAKNKLIEHNLRLVAHIAKKYSQGAGYDSDDLISIGTIGLIKAVDSYDENKNVRLASYASRCIENEILMMIRNSKKILREVSLDETLGGDSDGNEVTLMDLLASDGDDVLEEVNLGMDTDKAYRAINKCLNERERQIILLRYGLLSREYTQREIAEKLNISRSYVSRIEKKALLKINKFMNGKEI